MYAADIEGVKSVKNNLVVNATPAKPDAISAKMDDASITTQVKYALLSHEATSAVKTKVTAAEGDIVISGEVKTAAERCLVTKLAQDIRGSKSVANNMIIKL